MILLEHLEQKTDDELFKLLISAPDDLLIFVKVVWNKRHPEDPIKL